MHVLINRFANFVGPPFQSYPDQLKQLFIAAIVCSYVHVSTYTSSCIGIVQVALLQICFCWANTYLSWLPPRSSKLGEFSQSHFIICYYSLQYLSGGWMRNASPWIKRTRWTHQPHGLAKDSFCAGGISLVFQR